MVPETAVIVVVPAPAPVASPAALMVATTVFDEDHVAVLVRSFVLPSLNEPVAANCLVAPIWMEGVAGVTEIDARVGGAGFEFEVVWPPHATKVSTRKPTTTLRH